jgi:type VI secretion system protein ImpH
MATQGGRSSFDLKLDLLKEGHGFSFFQAMRLLRLFVPSSKGRSGAGFNDLEHIRVRPKLSLAFPPADVDSIEESEGEEPQFLVTVTPLGLYGASSPLPTFYTEDLLEEASEDESVTREFIDTINHRLFFLLFRCWTKYRQFIQVVEEKNPQHLERLFSLVGFGEEALRQDVPDAYGLLRYVGLFTQFPRSGAGLQALLQDAFGNVPVAVEPCVLRKARIPVDQRLMLGESGGALGVDSYIGEEMEDRMGKFRLRIGPLDRHQFQRLLPGGGGCEKLVFLTKCYITDPLEYDVELTLAEGEARGVCLGQPEWSRLGWDTWVFADEPIGEVKATLFPE